MTDFPARSDVAFLDADVPRPSPVPSSAPLPTGPVTFDTAEVQKNRVVVVARGLSRPWGLAFLPGGDMLVTERTSQLRVIRNGVLEPAPVAGVPAVRAQGLSGLMDIALHPRFGENRYVYLTYTSRSGRQEHAALARGTWTARRATSPRSSPSATATRSASSCIRAPARCGSTRRPQRRRRRLFTRPPAAVRTEERRRESQLVPLRQRIRDVRQGPDELPYLFTDETDGAVLRIEPAQ